MFNNASPRMPARNTSKTQNGSQDKTDRTTLDLSEPERQVLTALRQFCIGYITPNSDMWEAAFDTCMREFGPTHGPKIGVAVMKSLKV
ncbi:MAG: hypothetical protein ABJP66_12150, partial [Hyphomicrobiales bacterium]